VWGKGAKVRGVGERAGESAPARETESVRKKGRESGERKLIVCVCSCVSKGEGEGGRNSSDRAKQIARREKDRNEIEKCMCYSEIRKALPPRNLPRQHRPARSGRNSTQVYLGNKEISRYT
jgi:hypothetical protein